MSQINQKRLLDRPATVISRGTPCIKKFRAKDEGSRKFVFITIIQFLLRYHVKKTDITID